MTAERTHRARRGIWPRVLVSAGLLVAASFAGVFLLGGARALRPASAAAASVTMPAARAELSSQLSPSAAAILAAGRTLFVEACSTCHASDAQGSARGPNLVGLGGATIDLWLSNGWMPLAEPTAEPALKPARFDAQQQAEIVQYVTSLGPSSGPGVPYNIDLSRSNVADGFSLFALNCAPCHTITGAGDALASGLSAPPLHGVTKTQVWEAMRTGPGNMPRFGPGTLSPAQVNDVIAYVTKYIEHPRNPGGLGLGGVGPVAEGFVGLFVGVGACLLLAFWVGDRTEHEEGGDGHSGDGHSEDDGHEQGGGSSEGDGEVELIDA